MRDGREPPTATQCVTVIISGRSLSLSLSLSLSFTEVFPSVPDRGASFFLGGLSGLLAGWLCRGQCGVVLVSAAASFLLTCPWPRLSLSSHSHLPPHWHEKKKKDEASFVFVFFCFVFDDDDDDDDAGVLWRRRRHGHDAVGKY